MQYLKLLAALAAMAMAFAGGQAAAQPRQAQPANHQLACRLIVVFGNPKRAPRIADNLSISFCVETKDSLTDSLSKGAIGPPARVGFAVT